MRNTQKNQLFSAACKVCTPGCIASFNCGKSKSEFGTVPLFGTNTVCPLEKYGIEHPEEKRRLEERLMHSPDLDDLFVLCKHCEHRDASNDTPNVISTANCFETHCMDCPVQSCRENILECMAEGAMS